MDTQLNQSHLPAFFECISQDCHFRFPVLNCKELKASSTCPLCGSPTILSEIRVVNPASSRLTADPSRLHLVEVLVDNCRSAYNVGSIFRISDGAGIQHIHLCGITPTPSHRSVLKTSLGAEKHVSWTYHSNAKMVALSLQRKGYHIWALETGIGSISIFDVNFPPVHEPILVVIGNEVCGVDPAILKLCERQLLIPMYGIKESLNLSSAFGIAAYTLCLHLHNR